MKTSRKFVYLIDHPENIMESRMKQCFLPYWSSKADYPGY